MLKIHFPLCGRMALAAATLALAACATPTAGPDASAWFLSVQDGRAGLADGKAVVRDAIDTLAVIELSRGQLRVAHQIAMPTSLVGPPSSIAISPNGRLALISAATRRDPADATRVVPFDLVSVVSLDPSGQAAPLVSDSLRTGAGASGVSINRAGTLALVANRVEGSISVLAIDGDQVSVAGKVMLNEKAGPAHVAFTPDGSRALVTRDGDNRISLLRIDGRKVTVDPRDYHAGLRPYGLDVSPDGAQAVVGNLGGGLGDVDTISLIDLKAAAPRVVDTVSVGQTPEAVFFAPDGRSVAVTVIDGSNKPKASPFYGVARYRIFAIENNRLKQAGEVASGQWLQGHAFTPDGRAALVQDAASRRVHLYRLIDGSWADSGVRLEFDAAPSALKWWR